jgi:predicted acylesterase/phospholipase RssA
LETQDAFVLTGNGANAAFEVGVMKALMQGSWGRGRARPPIDPYCYVGTSLGAFNAAVMVSSAERGAAASLAFLEQLWCDRIAVERANSATGLFRMRGEFSQYARMALANPLQPLQTMTQDAAHVAQQYTRRFSDFLATADSFADRLVRLLDLSALVDLSPLASLVRESVNLDRIRTSARKLRVTATNWERGEPETFCNADFARRGHDIIVAALAVPGVVPPCLLDGTRYVDGALFVGTPIKPAIMACDPASHAPVVLHVVYLDTNLTPLPVEANTLSTVYRLYLMALSRAVNDDLDRVKHANTSIRTRDLLEAEIVHKTPDVTRMLRDLTEVLQGEVELTVHRYRPTRGVHGFALKQFERESVQELIEHGYEAAHDHDCAACDCIVVDS